MRGFFRKSLVATAFLAVFACFAALSYWVSHEDHEAKLNKLLVDGNGRIEQAFFTPEDDVRSILISLIALEKKSLRIAIYTITDKEIAQALVHAAKRGVHVECVVDRGYGQDKYSKVALLANEGIAVWVYQTSMNEREMALMHNKFCLFEDTIQHKSLLWTGSFNFTNRASTRNRENVIILDSQKLWDHYQKQFAILKMRSIQISGKIQKAQQENRISESTWLEKLQMLF
jgi:phosphatidylserine/phosphatidylglycerophosphate/cardiolipin synthase-like enzyme